MTDNSMTFDLQTKARILGLISYDCRYLYIMLQHDQQRNRAPTPDHLQGLPLSQRQYDSMRKMQEKQRNQEYNDLLAKVLGLYV